MRTTYVLVFLSLAACSSTPTPVTPTDSGTPMDMQISVDTPRPTDTPATTDNPAPLDVPASTDRGPSPDVPPPLPDVPPPPPDVPPPPPDVPPPPPDTGPPARAVTVPCEGLTPAATVSAPGFEFTPMTTSITMGQVVVFAMAPSHNAVSRDMLWNADFNVRTCVRFNALGTYEFFCGPHGFTGTIVVR